MKPKRRNSKFETGVVCLGNLRCWLQSQNYFGIIGEAKDTLMGWERHLKEDLEKKAKRETHFCLPQENRWCSREMPPLYTFFTIPILASPPHKAFGPSQEAHPPCRIVVIRYQIAKESCPSRMCFPGGGRRAAWLGRGCCLSLAQKEALVQSKGTQLPWHLTDTPSQESPSELYGLATCW